MNKVRVNNIYRMIHEICADSELWGAVVSGAVDWAGDSDDLGAWDAVRRRLAGIDADKRKKLQTVSAGI